MNYETVIGLEVHVELKTNTKAFCGCRNQAGSDPNTNVCPVCLGMPGVLPVINEKVVEFAIKAGLAFNCGIAHFSKFDRKNYYYPDLPKNFQTSQYDLPICGMGYLDIDVNGEPKRIGITRIHMEEDAGKLVHPDTITTSDYAQVDYNRTGVPLLEIVSEPDMRSPEEARAYLETLKTILQYLDISDCKMEEGSLRCDANISLRPVGQKEFGTKSELKNLNSFKAVQRALEYEVARQEQLLDEGGRVVQETRTWDENQGITLSMRSKEQAHDYRYFPEPDLVPVIVDDAWIERVRLTLPELPAARKQRMIDDYGLTDYEAMVVTQSKDLADYFDACAKLYDKPAALAKILLGDFAKNLNAVGADIRECVVKPQQLVALCQLLDKNTISGKIAKTVIGDMFATGKDPEIIVKEKGLVQISDTAAIEQIVAQVVEANPKSVEDFKAGKDKAIGFLVGQIMKQTKGRANPGMVNQLLKDKLSKL